MTSNGWIRNPSLQNESSLWLWMRAHDDGLNSRYRSEPAALNECGIRPRLRPGGLNVIIKHISSTRDKSLFRRNNSFCGNGFKSVGAEHAWQQSFNHHAGPHWRAPIDDVVIPVGRVNTFVWAKIKHVSNHCAWHVGAEHAWQQSSNHHAGSTLAGTNRRCCHSRWACNSFAWATK